MESLVLREPQVLLVHLAGLVLQVPTARKVHKALPVPTEPQDLRVLPVPMVLQVLLVLRALPVM